MVKIGGWRCYSWRIWKMRSREWIEIETLASLIKLHIGWYFREHDFNQDNSLDGLEIFKALQHELPRYFNREEYERLPARQQQQKMREWQQSFMEDMIGKMSSILIISINQKNKEEISDILGIIVYCKAPFSESGMDKDWLWSSCFSR